MAISLAVRRSRSKDIQRKAAQEAEDAFEREFGHGIELRLIDSQSDQAWRQQWKRINNREPPNGGWDWPDQRKWCDKSGARIGVALWYNDILCGLALGVTNRNAVSIKLIEGNPGRQHPLSGYVLLAVTLLFEVYQKRLGLRQAKIVNPTPGLIPKVAYPF